MGDLHDCCERRLGLSGDRAGRSGRVRGLRVRRCGDPSAILAQISNYLSSLPSPQQTIPPAKRRSAVGDCAAIRGISSPLVSHSTRTPSPGENAVAKMHRPQSTRRDRLPIFAPSLAVICPASKEAFGYVLAGDATAPIAA